MKVTPAHILMPILCIMVGIALVCVGLFGGWGLVWAAGGGFFVTVGIGAGLLTLAWMLPGRAGIILQRPIVNVLILCAVVAMMALTVCVGMVSHVR
jgi:hypothetical protein